MSFSGSLASMVNVSKFTRCISLNYQLCMTRPILIDLNSDEYNQGLRYYPFLVNLDTCNGSSNIVDGLSDRICVPNKTEDVNLSVFNIITRTKESKTLRKFISCKCKCKFDGRTCN